MTPDLRLCDWKLPSGGENDLPSGSSLKDDFITKPLDIVQALATVSFPVQHLDLQREVELLRQRRFRDRSVEDIHKSDDGLEPQLIGNSPARIEILKSIGSVAATDV